MIFGIPNKILELAYNSSDNFLVSIEKISTTGISITIKDSNEYKSEHEYSNDYKIVKKNNTGNYGNLTKKSNDTETVNSIKIDNSTVKNIYNWKNVYGNLESGEYEFRAYTSDHRMNLFIKFTINDNGNITYKEPTCIYF